MTVEDGARSVQFHQDAYGTVIGDHAQVKIVRQSTALPTAREAPAVPVHFTGREALVADVADGLIQGPVTVLVGMGGAGKTTLAARVAALPDMEARFPDGTFWVDLRVDETADALSRIALAYGHDITSLEKVESRARTLHSVLRDKRALLVLDDAWSVAELRPFLFGSLTARVLITTRDDGLANELSDTVVSITTLTEAESVALLRQLIGRPDVATTTELAQLSALVGHLPLALEVAGRRVRKQARQGWFQFATILRELQDATERLKLARRETVVFETSWSKALDDEGRARYASLGLFPQGDMQQAAVAAAWDVPEAAARATLGELTDLSLLSQTGPTTYRLHPLLFDFVAVKHAEAAPTAVRAAHQRVSDCFFNQATVAEPASLDDVRPALQSLHHAAQAGDAERHGRAFPWLGDVPLPGFLKGIGAHRTLITLLEQRLGLVKAAEGWPAAWARYQLGSALFTAGDVASAIPYLQQSLDELDSADEDEVVTMLVKVVYELAHARKAAGDLAAAIALFERLIGIDQRHGGDYTLTMVQLGDCHLMGGDLERALDVYEQARATAAETGAARSEGLALVRLAERTDDDTQALAWLQRASSLDVYQGADGSQQLHRLGECYAERAMNGVEPSPVRDAVLCYGRAIQTAHAAGARFQESIALYSLGNLFEHLFLCPRWDSDLPGAFACYELADRLAGDMELPPGINPRERLESRIKPRIAPEELAAITERVLLDPGAEVQSAVNRVLVQ